MQLEDEYESKYFINYISDDSDGLDEDNNNNNNNKNENNQIEDDSHDIDVSTLPNSLIITPVPQELFTDQSLKVNILIFLF